MPNAARLANDRKSRKKAVDWVGQETNVTSVWLNGERPNPI
jgi:hypothetical protein